MSENIDVFDQLNWDNVWQECFEHYQQDIRFAYYVNAFLEKGENVLEIGAGSFRDVNTLNSIKRNCTGVDYSHLSIEMARERFPYMKDQIIEGNAFDLPFEDKSFDSSYSNGFIGCFSDDDIRILLREQVRVTRNKVMVAVHNKHNRQFVNYFEQKKQIDPIFAIRFFSTEEITALLAPFSKDIKIIPVGKAKKTYEDDLINIGLRDAGSLRKEFDYHGMSLLDISERLLCIAEL